MAEGTSPQSGGLADLFDAWKAATGPVTLDSSVAPELHEVLHYFGLDTLAVADPKPALAGGVLILDGNATALGAAAQIHLAMSGAAPYQIALQMTLPASWTFATSFPGLPQSFKPMGGSAGGMSLQPSLLYDFHFSSASLTGQSFDGGGLVQGLNFSGILSDTSPFGWLAAQAIGDMPALSGILSLADGQPPQAALTLSLAHPTLDWSPLPAISGLELQILTGPDDYISETVTFVQLSGNLPISGSDGSLARLSAPFDGSGESVRLIAQFPSGAISLQTGLDGLSSLAGGLSLPTPPSLALPVNLSLVGFSLSVQLEPLQVRHLQFRITSDKPWPVVTGVVVSDIDMGWLILSPFDGSQRSISAAILATLTLGSGADAVIFDVAAHDYRGFLLEGSLRAGSTIQLVQLAASAIDRDAAGLPTLNVTALDIAASIAGDLSINATLDVWDVGVPGLPLNLDQVSGSFTRTSAGGKSGSLGARFTLGGIQMWVDAEIPEGDNGFQFAGGTYGPAQQFSLGTLAAGLTAQFHASLPDALSAFLNDILITKVDVTFDSKSGHFTFVATGTFQLGDRAADLTLSVDVTRDPATPTTPYSCEVTGTVAIGERQFALLFAKESAATMLAAHYANAGGDAIDVKALVTDASPSFGALVPDGISIGVKDVLLIVSKPASGTQIAFGLGLDASLDLTDLPLVGGAIPDDAKISVSDIHFAYSSAALDAAAVKALAPALAKAGITLPAQGLAEGVNLSAQLDLAGTKETLQLGMPAATPTAPPPPATNAASPPATAPTTAAPAAAPSTGAKYYNLQKQLGPISFKRIGAQYSNNALMFLLDASIAVGPLTFSMDGLGVGSSVSSFEPCFDLSGLGLAYNQPPVEIAGALLHLPKASLADGVDYQFDGTLVVKAEEYSLAAIGSYAKLTDGSSSLFLFAQIEAALGGPPAFFVTGLMGGFGYNRLLRTPGQDEVLDFPLLKLASGGGQKPMDVLDLLEGTPGGTPAPWITPSPGDDWAAIGIEFTSFELVHSKALLIVDFGRDFQAALLGLSTMRLPQPEDNGASYAYAELELEAVLKPQEGYFGLTAILSKNSYVLTPDCHLTGGFAFSIWYGPSDHSGEFVLTLGGYHPAFQPPSYFPQVPRLGFNWAVSDDVTIKGDAYFALTTSSIMAGGGLEILFHDGDLGAWFTAHADVLISWHPFFFIADIDVSIGVSYRVNLLFCSKTISVSVGASVHMWGPPTGGTVHVHLWIVSFTVNFGADESAVGATALEWTDFRNLLPKPELVVRISAANGLYKTLDGATDGDPKIWVVRAADFRFTTRSAIPATALAYGTASADAAPAKLNIRPMNRTGVSSMHTLTIYEQVVTPRPPPGAPKQWQAVSAAGWTLTPQTAAVPESLWQVPPDPFSQIPDAPAANVIPGQLVGYAVSAPAPAIGPSRGLVALEALAEDRVATGAAPLSPNVASTSAHLPGINAGSIADSIADIEQVAGAVAGQRMALFNLLSQTASAGAPVYAGSDGGMAKLAVVAGHLFSDAPMELA
ncbi:MAG: DUF6603 domain-containing protein [Allosphingosinicella sp.]